jgi:hypothetical protein
VAEIRLYAIYDHPTDYPPGFVLREWLITSTGMRTGQAWAAPTLEQAREMIPDGTERQPRDPDDDTKIVEVWM